MESEILQHWSRVVYAYARDLRSAERRRQSWRSCRLLVSAAKEFWLGEGRAIDRLLVRSRETLGFEDPLTLRFDLHRWLGADREEAYSDWLAWIVNQLRTGEMVGRLFFGDQVPCEIRSCHERVTADRETWVPEGRRGQKGRTDCVIRFGDAALVLIEVKLTDTRNSDLGALPGYRKWLDAQPFGFRRALLLVTDRNADGEHDGFHIVTWKELCLNLRRLLPDLVKRAETITAVLSAAFVGAVEINLLGFPPLRWNGGKSEDEMVGRVSLLGSRIDELIQHLSSARF